MSTIPTTVSPVCGNTFNYGKLYCYTICECSDGKLGIFVMDRDPWNLQTFGMFSAGEGGGEEVHTQTHLHIDILWTKL